MLPEQKSSIDTLVTTQMLLDMLPAAAHAKAGSSMRKRQENIIANTVDLLNAFGSVYGLDRFVNLSRFLGQIAVESDYFRTTMEYASGKAYEGRSDLGNVKAGDGIKFKGHGLIQTTGRYNHQKFTVWAKKHLGGIIKDPIPDFVETPEKLCEFPWAFFSAAYYWSVGNPTGRSLNELAQAGNDEMITRRINGGLTHFDRRLEMTANAALILLKHKTTAAGIKKFQEEKSLAVDGMVGVHTRNALHLALRQRDMSVLDERTIAIRDAIAQQAQIAVTKRNVPVAATPRSTKEPEAGWLSRLICALFGGRK